MRSTLSQIVWSSAVLVVAMGLGIVGWAQEETPREAGKTAGSDTTIACACSLQDSGAKPGAQEPPASAPSEELSCQVQGRTTILTLLPEGTIVQKGQLVCVLDSSALRDALTNQLITTNEAEAAYQNAKVDTEVAKNARHEFVEGTAKLQLQSAKGEVALAKEQWEAAQQRAKEAEEGGSRSARTKAAQALQRAKQKYELAQTRLSTLEKYTIPRRMAELESLIEKAKAIEMIQQAVREREVARQEKLRRQIEHCKLYASIAGQVHHVQPKPVNDLNRIEEGATVRERQLIARIVPEKKE